jgi:hypothetical protein
MIFYPDELVLQDQTRLAPGAEIGGFTFDGIGFESEGDLLSQVARFRRETPNGRLTVMWLTVMVYSPYLATRVDLEAALADEWAFMSRHPPAPAF